MYEIIIAFKYKRLKFKNIVYYHRKKNPSYYLVLKVVNQMLLSNKI